MLQGLVFLMNGNLNPILGAEQGVAPGAAPAAEAAAQTAAAAPPPVADPGLFGTGWIFGIWILIIVGFYFITIRPQRRREKQMKEMQSSIGVGEMW